MLILFTITWSNLSQFDWHATHNYIFCWTEGVQKISTSSLLYAILLVFNLLTYKSSTYIRYFLTTYSSII
jgi:hypothetical protein